MDNVRDNMKRQQMLLEKMTQGEQELNEECLTTLERNTVKMLFGANNHDDAIDY